MTLDVKALRRQFPFLDVPRGETPPVYLDSAATAQKPRAVIDAVGAFYTRGLGNVHRGMHRQTEHATAAYEAARDNVRAFIHAAHAEEIIFTKNATEAINLVAHAWARANLQPNDIVMLSILEHHANIIPWLQLKEERDIDIRWIDCDNAGELHLDQLNDALRTGRMKLVCLSGQSNVLGTRPSIESVASAIHKAGARLLIDASQLAAHAPLDVQKLDCDFLAFSGHKVYGPNGIGVLYARRDVEQAMHPFLGGGGMVREVQRENFVPLDAPARFEAGTPPIADAVGLAAAIGWQEQISWADRQAHERMLIMHIMEKFSAIKGLHILGSGDPEKTFGCVSFTIDGIHPHDLTDLLGQKGIALRGGNQCAALLHERLGITASTRLSVGLYTTVEEIDACVRAIEEVRRRFGD